MAFSVNSSGEIKNGILTGPKGQFKIPYTLHFQISQDRLLHYLEKFSARFIKFAQPQNLVCISQKRSQKDSNLRPLLTLRWTTPAGPCHADITDPSPVANRNRTDIPYNHSGNRPFFKSHLPKCAQFSGRYLCSNRRLIPEFTPSSGDFRRFRIAFPRICSHY